MEGRRSIFRPQYMYFTLIRNFKTGFDRVMLTHSGNGKIADDERENGTEREKERKG